MFVGSAIAVLIICLSFLFLDWLSYSNGDSFGHAQGDLPAPETAPCARVGDSRCNQRKNCPYKNLEFAGVNQVGDLRQLRAIGANEHEGNAVALTTQNSACAPLMNQSLSPKTSSPTLKPLTFAPTDSMTPENSWLKTIGYGRGSPNGRLKVVNH